MYWKNKMVLERQILRVASKFRYNSHAYEQPLLRQPPLNC
jgi:hypothetical protein